MLPQAINPGKRENFKALFYFVLEYPCSFAGGGGDVWERVVLEWSVSISVECLDFYLTFYKDLIC